MGDGDRLAIAEQAIANGEFADALAACRALLADAPADALALGTAGMASHRLGQTAGHAAGVPSHARGGTSGCPGGADELCASIRLCRGRPSPPSGVRPRS